MATQRCMMKWGVTKLVLMIRIYSLAHQTAKNVNAISGLWISFHFLSNCLRQHPNTFESLTSSSCARESSRCVQHFQSLLLVEGPALSPWYLGRRENGCFRAKHNHHLNVWSCQIKSAMLFCVDSRGWSRSSPYRLIALLSALKDKSRTRKMSSCTQSRDV